MEKYLGFDSNPCSYNESCLSNVSIFRLHLFLVRRALWGNRVRRTDECLVIMHKGTLYRSTCNHPTISTKSLCLIKQQNMKTYGEEKVWLFAFLTSALGGHEWSASRPGRYTPGEIAHSIHWMRRKFGLKIMNLRSLAFAGNRTPISRSSNRSLT